MDQEVSGSHKPQLKVAVQMLNRSSASLKKNHSFVFGLQNSWLSGFTKPSSKGRWFLVSKLDEIQSEKLEAESTEHAAGTNSSLFWPVESLLNKMENFVDGVFYGMPCQ